MAQKAEISKEKWAAIIAWWKNELSYRKIAETMKVSYNGVKTTVNKFKRT